MVIEDNEIQEAAPKTSGIDIKIIIIAAIFFVAALAGSYLMIKSVMAPLMPKEETKVEEAKEVTTGTLVDIGEFTVNISDGSGTRYLKAEIVIEVNDPEAAGGEGEPENLPILRDQVITILSSKTPADLDANNRDVLKKEIKTKLNKSMANKITNVYFNSFIMQ